MNSNSDKLPEKPAPFVPGEDWTLLSQGAEARIWKIPNYDAATNKPAIAKERFSKKYRHPVLDERLTKQRCRMEARILTKCQKTAKIDVPAVLRVDRAELYLEYIAGPTLRDYLEETVLINNNNNNNGNSDILKSIAKAMGSVVAKLHSAGMIHGDLTTSNMMLRQQQQSKTITETDTTNITLIDFGLAKNSTSAEERAVDLYVLERALSSTHPTLPLQFFSIWCLEEYERVCNNEQEEQTNNNNNNKNKKNNTNTLARLEQVRQRGRKRECFG